MLRSAAGKVMWVGRATVFLIGLAVILGLIFGVATTALGANGSNFVLGTTNNTATALTKLTANVQGPAMQVQNTNPGTDDTALSLSVQPGEAPMRVNSTGRVTNLNADKLDGLDSTGLMRGSTYVKTEPLPIADGVSNSTVLYCSSPSDRVLGGGFSKQASVEVTSSTPYVNPSDSGGQGWGLSAADRTSGDGGASVTVHVLCSDFPPAHTS